MLPKKTQAKQDVTKAKAPETKVTEETAVEKARRKVEELAKKRIAFIKKKRNAMKRALTKDDVEEAYLILNDVVALEGETPANKREFERLGVRFLERRKSSKWIDEVRRESDTVKALALSEKVARDFPNDAKTHLTLGQCYMSLAELRRREGNIYKCSSLRRLAQKSFEKAIDIESTHQEAYFLLAEVHAAIGSNDFDISAHYNRSYRCDKNTWLGILAKARSEELGNNLDGALKKYSEVLEKKRDLKEALLPRAEIYRWAQKYKMALSDVARVLKNRDNDPDALVLRAYIRYDQEDWVGSREDIEKAVVLDKGHARALALRAHHKLRDGDREGALKDGDAAQKLDRYCADAARVRGIVYLTAERPNVSAAESILFLACQRQRFNAENHYWYGRGMESSHNLSKALRAYSKCLSLNKQNWRAFLSRARCHRSHYDFESALSDVEQALALQPKNGRVYLERAKIRSGRLRKKGTDYKLAPWKDVLSDLNSAIRLQPNLADAYGQRAIFYWNRGQLKDALNDCNLAIQGKPEHLYVVHGYRGLIYAEQKETNKAISDLSKYLNSADEAHPIYKRVEQEYSRLRVVLDKKK